MKMTLIQGDCLKVLPTLPGESVDCVITSPPYWGLRDYGTAIWEGGNMECNHKINDSRIGSTAQVGNTKTGEQGGATHIKLTDVCPKCGARRIDSQLGLEKTPEEYVAKLVKVFREVRRMLKKEGTLWLNLGDTYATPKVGNTQSDIIGKHDMLNAMTFKKELPPNLKPKDLVGIPWRVAFALQADGWYLRQDIIWNKPNPMPESVTDRCTKAHEYIFLLTKSPKYYYDSEAIKEKSIAPGSIHIAKNNQKMGEMNGIVPQHNIESKETRNKRSVWTITTKPFKEAHFATFPEALVEPMIKASCPLDGTALDPFMGSGTVGVVCIKHRRNFIGIDLKKEYVEMAKRRLGLPSPFIESEFKGMKETDGSEGR